MVDETPKYVCVSGRGFAALTIEWSHWISYIPVIVVFENTEHTNRKTALGLIRKINVGNVFSLVYSCLAYITAESQFCASELF